MNLNRVFLIGRLTRDPETRALPSGRAVTNLSLATSRFYTDKSGEKQEDTEFHNLVLFGRTAEIASQYLSKGSLAFFEGRLRTRNWEDSSGNKRYRTEVIVRRLQLAPKSLSPTVGSKQEKKAPPAQDSKEKEEEEIPVIEEEEIDVEDIPF
ncbi:MAG: single-stranded DNA-binding protein [Candidatus Nealsonbacteria bacterium]|nr:single-stranded DNA-binding protein [Candidatus Nealsonbacteria bacterium]